MTKNGIFLILMLLSCRAIGDADIQVVTEELPPFNYTNDEGQIVGLATERLKVVMALAGLNYEIRSYPWARAYNIAQNEPNVLIYTIYRTPEREQLFKWICPLIAPGPAYLYRLKSREDIQIDNLNDISRYSVSVTAEGMELAYLRSKGMKPGKHLDLASDTVVSYRKLLAGRVDLVLSSTQITGGSLEAMGYPRDRVVPAFEIKELNDREGCMAFGLKTDDALVEKVRRAFAQHTRMANENK